MDYRRAFTVVKAILQLERNGALFGVEDEVRQKEIDTADIVRETISHSSSSTGEIRDVEEQSCTSDSDDSNRQAQNGQRHLAGMPTALFQRIGEVVHRCSELIGPHNSEDAEG
jgi:hypothetical protein